VLTASAKKFLSHLLKATILVLAFIFIYQRVGDNKNLKQFERLINQLDRVNVIIILSLVVLLMLVNWVLESLKWRYLSHKLSPTTIWKSIEAVFCGLTLAVFTPNRIGEYGGRVMFMPKRKRIHGMFAMAVGSFAQSVITNVLGAMALMWFLWHFHQLNAWLYFAVFIMAFVFIVLMLVFYFHIRWSVTLLNSIPFLRKFNRFFRVMGYYRMRELLKIMYFSLARFFVFSFQYYLVIHLLIPEIAFFPMMMLVFILFFIQSALPSLDLLDIGVRSMISDKLFGYVTDQHIAVIAAVSSIWLINLIIPAVLGSVFVLKLKFFDRSY
jgi:hypothetical protein